MKIINMMKVIVVSCLLNTHNSHGKWKKSNSFNNKKPNGDNPFAQLMSLFFAAGLGLFMRSFESQLAA